MEGFSAQVEIMEWKKGLYYAVGMHEITTQMHDILYPLKTSITMGDMHSGCSVTDTIRSGCTRNAAEITVASGKAGLGAVVFTAGARHELHCGAVVAAHHQCRPSLSRHLEGA